MASDSVERSNAGGESDVRKWLVRFRPNPSAALRLFCFPYAGVGASAFFPWARELPGGIELVGVQLPGRESRIREKPIGSLSSLTTELVNFLHPHLDRPYAFFGHSMGALMCFELARELRRRDRPLPCHLLVSGQPAPQLPRRHDPLAHLPDADFVEQLHRRYGYALPEDDEQLDELLDVMLPTLRSDVMVTDDYVHGAEAPFDCPITAFGGLDDPTVTRHELDAWRHQTRGLFRTRMLPGGHFYLESEWKFLVRFIVDSLRSTL